MTQEDKKELVFKDLSARIPYNNTMVNVARADTGFEIKIKWYDEKLTSYLLYDVEENDAWEYIKPYLRSISSMTKEEAEEMFHLMYPNDKLLKVEI